MRRGDLAGGGARHRGRAEHQTQSHVHRDQDAPPGTAAEVAVVLHRSGHQRMGDVHDEHPLYDESRHRLGDDAAEETVAPERRGRRHAVLGSVAHDDAEPMPAERPLGAPRRVPRPRRRRRTARNPHRSAGASRTLGMMESGVWDRDCPRKFIGTPGYALSASGTTQPQHHRVRQERASRASPGGPRPLRSKSRRATVAQSLALTSISCAANFWRAAACRVGTCSVGTSAGA